MPAMVPSYNKERADKATKEILALLAEKYNVGKFPPTPHWVGHRDARVTEFQKAVHTLFELDSWEGF